MLEEFYDDTEVDLWSEFEAALGLITGENVYTATKLSVDKDDDLEKELRQQDEVSPRCWTNYFHRYKKKFVTKQAQADAISKTLNTIGIPVVSQNVVCDEDAVGLFL